MFWNLILGLALLILGYLLMPKPKQPKPDAVQELEAPTAEAGKTIPTIFGDITLKSPNYNWYGDIQNVRKSKKSNKK